MRQLRIILLFLTRKKVGVNKGPSPNPYINPGTTIHRFSFR